MATDIDFSALHEDDLSGSGREGEGLDGVGLKAEPLASEADGVEGVADLKKRRHQDPPKRVGNGERGPRCREPRESFAALSLWRRGGATNRANCNTGRPSKKIAVFVRRAPVCSGVAAPGQNPNWKHQSSSRSQSSIALDENNYRWI